MHPQPFSSLSFLLFYPWRRIIFSAFFCDKLNHIIVKRAGCVVFLFCFCFFLSSLWPPVGYLNLLWLCTVPIMCRKPNFIWLLFSAGMAAISQFITAFIKKLPTAAGKKVYWKPFAGWKKNKTMIQNRIKTHLFHCDFTFYITHLIFIYMKIQISVPVNTNEHHLPPLYLGRGTHIIQNYLHVYILL